MAVETYKPKKRIFIPDPEHCKDFYRRPLKNVGETHYDIAQTVFMDNFFKEKYGLSTKNPEQYKEIIRKRLLERYQKDRDEEGLTTSERYKLLYYEKFLSGRFRIPEKERRWVEILKQKVDDIKERLGKDRGRRWERKNLLEEILNEKTAALLLVFSIGLSALSIFSRMSATGYAAFEGGGFGGFGGFRLDLGDYSLIFALVFFIAGVVVFLVKKRKR